MDTSHFCGWQILLKCLGYANNEDEKNLIAFAFETGGRISEVLQLRTDMFKPMKETKPPILVVRGMPLLRQSKKSNFPLRVRSDFVIRIDEPLTKIMLQAIIKHLHDNQPLIFLNSSTGKLYGRRWAYKVLRRIGGKAGIYLYPQRLRCERAYHLGKSLKAESLVEWFTWDNWSSAKRYSKKDCLRFSSRPRYRRQRS